MNGGAVSEWRDIQLGEWVETAKGSIKTGPFGSQLHAYEYIDDPLGIPVVMPKDMVNGRVARKSVSRVAEETAERLKTHRMAPGDLVLARRGDVGRHAFIEAGEAGWLCGTGAMRVHAPDRTVIWPDFLRHAMANPEVTDWLVSRAVGATMPNLNGAIVAEVPLRVPGPRTQRHIAAALTAFNELIEINDRRIELLEDLARALYREWFVRFRFPGHRDVTFVESELGAIPDGWHICTLADIARVIVDGVAPSDVATGSPYVGLEHLPRRSTTLREWGDIESVVSRKLRFAPGDTLFGKIRPYFHKVAWAPCAGVASSDTIVVRAHGEQALPALVNAVLSSDALVAQAVATSNGTKMPRADPAALLGYPLVLPRPDSAIVGNFEQASGTYLLYAASLSEQNRCLAATRNLLLPCLVTGQLDISDVDLGDLLPPEAA
jgi:type I restriction enzyme, S subunit